MAAAESARLPDLTAAASATAGLYTTTFPRRYANLANALYLGAPAQAATSFGVGGAIITGMYKDPILGANPSREPG